MAAKVFVVVLEADNPEAAARIEAIYPESYRISDTCFLVSGNDTTAAVARKVGIKGSDRIDEGYGAVFRLNGSYSGYASSDLWEWLEQVEE